MWTGWMTGAAMMLLAGSAAAPALADVKSGVDAYQRGDYKRAIEEWRAPALAGDPDAQFNLGQAYKLGRGVPVDPALARSWFLKAAKQGHLQASDNYGLALFENDQRAEAAPWLEKSAARFEPRAQLVLGTMLFNGDGVPRDYPRAYALITRAAQQPLTARPASETLAQMDQYITPADRQQGIALAQRYAAEQNAVKMANAGRPDGGTALVDSSPPATMATRPVRGEPLPPSRAADPATMAPRPIRREPLPPSRSADPTPMPVRDIDPPRRAPPPPPRPRPQAPPVRVAAGQWKIQLGAFRDQGRARALWGSVAGRLPGARPIFASAGGITRVQAGPFATRADAQRACAASKVNCDVIAP